jgi:predicted ABC-type ATPase
MPTFRIIAGPNGAGKTTLAGRYLADELKNIEFVNVDLISIGLSPFDPDRGLVDAGQVAMMRISRMLQDGKEFTWETSFSGSSGVLWLRQAKSHKYQIDGNFIWVRDPLVALERVQLRSRQGGATMHPDIVGRRHAKSLAGFFNMYRPLLDTWRFFVSVDGLPVMLAHYRAARLHVRDAKMWGAIQSDAAVAIPDVNPAPWDETVLDAGDYQVERAINRAMLDAIDCAKSYHTDIAIEDAGGMKRLSPGQTRDLESRLSDRITKIDARITELTPGGNAEKA